jgi:D-alanine-D-alanine ligase
MNTDFGRVGVLYGGVSAEREVSLMSGRGVHAALLEAGVDAHLFDTGAQSLSELEAAGFDRVFIALHGRHGEDGTLQGALELLGLPYTGSGPLASCLAMDKTTTKRIWAQQNLPTPAFRTVSGRHDLAGLIDQLGLPLIVKPPHEGSTVGVTKVTSADELDNAWALASQYDSQVLVERFIAGRELTVSLLGKGDQTRVLPIVEIIAPQGNYDYEHKYISNDTQYVCPAHLDDELTREIMGLSRRAYVALGCEGWGRVDIMLDEAGRPWLLEVNTSPGMTSHSLVPMGARAAGMSYSELCVAILAEAGCKVPAPSRGIHALGA